MQEPAVHSMMRAMTTQFMAICEPQMLSEKVRKVATASVMAAGLVGAGMAPAQAQQQQDVLPRNSAAYWGGQVGGALLGQAAQAVQTGNYILNRAIVGVASEVGRNVGRQAAVTPYGQNGAQQQRSYAPMRGADVDFLDTMALRTVFSYERLAQTQNRSSQYQMVLAAYEADKANFNAAYRAAISQGGDARPWAPLVRVFGMRVGTISFAHLQEQAAPMLSRLQRPGGPGFVETPVVQTLDGLRQQMRQPDQNIHHDQTWQDGQRMQVGEIPMSPG